MYKVKIETEYWNSLYGMYKILTKCERIPIDSIKFGGYEKYVKFKFEGTEKELKQLLSNLQIGIKILKIKKCRFGGKKYV